jgi:hypothetical protein
MMAYIAFIILCAIVHDAYPIPSWEKLVSAITVSSAFFAFADPFLALANAMNRVIRSADNYCNETMNSIGVERAELNKISIALEVNDLDSPLIEKNKRLVNEVLSLIAELEDSLNETKQITLAGKKLAKRETRAGASLTIIGFFLFFCIITFPPISSFAIKLQDTITIFAFALVLLSQFIQDGLSDKVEEIIDKHNHGLIKYYSLCNSLMHLKESSLDCISNEEAYANAD